MKIVTWNCNGALRKKVSELDALDADVLIVQECENPAESTPAYRDWAGNYLWKGLSKNKGIGVFPRKNNKVSEAKWSGSFDIAGMGSKNPATHWQTEDLELFLPFTLNSKYTLLGVWTKGGDNKAFNYIGQLWKYLQIHKTELSSQKSLVLGDFNSNAIWDKSDCWWNHSDVVAELLEIGIQSVYHSLRVESPGEETTPTLFLQRNISKPYHVDYVFASEDLLPQCQIDVGSMKHWLHISDHMPLTVEITD
jgi:exodeoxyribonuclease-3